MAFPFASLISAGGALLGGLFGGSPKPPKIISSGDQLKSTVEAAKEIGIHPLAALGAGTQYTAIPQPQPQNRVGRGIAAAARQIGRIPGQQLAKEMQASNLEVNTAQAALLRQQATSLNAETVANLRNGTTGARNISDPDKPADLMHQVTGPDGKVFTVADQQVAPEPEQDLYAHGLLGTFWKQIKTLVEDNNYPIWKADRDIKNVMAKLNKAQARRLQSAWAALRATQRRSTQSAPPFGPTTP